MTPSGIYLMLRRNGVVTRPRTVYDVKSDFFDNIDSEAKAYWLGMMYADGYNSVARGSIEIMLIGTDSPILERMAKEIGFSGPIADKGRYKRLFISNRRISDRLEELGCGQKKSGTLEFPKWMPSNLVRHFIRGYFDGDGSVYFNSANKNLGVCFAGTQDIVFEIAEEIKRMTGRNGYMRHRHTHVYTVEYGGNIQARQIYDWMYHGATIWLPRKRDVFVSHYTRDAYECPN